MFRFLFFEFRCNLVVSGVSEEDTGNAEGSYIVRARQYIPANDYMAIQPKAGNGSQ
jgi:hypothetical protein